EWNGPAELADVLAAFGLSGWTARKPQPSTAEQPRAHYWEVLAGTSRYFLKRFYPWYPNSAIRYMHSVLVNLGRQQVPVPQWVADTRTGESFTELAGMRWALYRALEGRTATRQDWMWGRPKAAETLAMLHLRLEGFTPGGEEFRPWGAWTLETVDRVLESWQP